MAEQTSSDVTGDGRSAAVVQSVDRALLVLEILGALGTAGITEIATELGVHKSTASRLVAVLESRGYVEQLSERGKYRLGFTFVRLAGSTSAQMSLGKASQAVCDELANITGETTNVAILDRDQIINVVESIGPAEVTLRTWVGQRCPAHATSSGKILLSSLSALELQKLLPKTLAAFTPHTVCDRQLLERELDTSRRTGWASVHEELEVGLNAVAAPIVDHNGTTIAALSVSGPAYRLQPGSFDQVAEKTVEAAVRISRRLGFGG